MFNAITYISIVIITFIFTYIFDIRENFTLLYMLLVAPIFDYLILIYLKKQINIHLDDVSESIEKRKDLICTLYIVNKAVIPVPFLEYEFNFSSKFNCYDEEFFRERISLGGKSTICEEYSLFAAHRGLGNVNLSSVQMRSLLGLFKESIIFDGAAKEVMVIPALVEVEGVEDLLEGALDDDEYDDNTNNMFIGDPSYEFKEYAPGDPLNRVNWKISSKRNILMIRKSAMEVKLNKTIILDPAILERGDFEDRGDLLIEAVIGMAREFFALDYSVDIFYYRDRYWEKFGFDNMDSIPNMQKFFSTYNFINISNFNKRFNKLVDKIEKTSDYVLFTNNKDIDVRDFAIILQEYGNSVNIVSDNRNKIIDNEYYLHADYTLERI
ncbi:DUF58 domain-containing protein [Clostridium sp. LP20]|uniref:DUF58 domain-containing protein n=1 Tax=Clostridium sp. LP20 TaxID=3418665 RepID=UPI003EE7669F